MAPGRGRRLARDVRGRVALRVRARGDAGARARGDAGARRGARRYPVRAEGPPVVPVDVKEWTDTASELPEDAVDPATPC
ncbi:hypothetical protein ACFWVP_16755 [Streptomyces sp. NPDC058637]|uniref:hypothetical protein n=1 Tax=Streptomyces sp. NPDC058637 TaxID=3346569 RepID=UPI0036527595